MTTYTRVVDGRAVDVVVTPPELAERFHPDWLARQTFYVAPDDTANGRYATVNQDGSVAWGDNPPPDELQDVIEALSQQQMLDTKLDAIAKALNVNLDAAVAAAQAQLGG